MTDKKKPTHRVITTLCRHNSARRVKSSLKCRDCGVVWDMYYPRPVPHKYKVRHPLVQPKPNKVTVGTL